VATRLPFDRGITHYDAPPPEALDDLGQMQREGRFRFANELRAYVEVEDGKIASYGQSGGGRLCSTNVSLFGRNLVFNSVALPDLRHDPVVGNGEVTFSQTAGGRTGVPAPRRVRRAPYIQLAAPLAWTTLSLTIRADGSTSRELAGASPFPRHWLYDGDGQVTAKSGLIDFSSWWRRAFGRHSPWGDEDSATLVTEVETALERDLSAEVMGGMRPEIRKLGAGSVLIEQGSSGTEMFLLLDGVVGIEVNGERLAECGPGSLHGERAVIEGGARTATVRAITPCKVAIAAGSDIDPAVLENLREGHRREEIA
jgi:hypothetical protein